MNYYVGVDGGGTKTSIAVSNEDQKIIYTDFGGTINFCGADFAVAKQNIKDIFNKALKAVNTTVFTKVVVGSSSNYKSDTQNFLEEFISAIPAKSVQVYDDADIALKSTDDENCGVVISGTGSMLIGKAGGKVYTVGGYGHIIGDEGSAYDIAIRGIKSAIKSYDGWGKKTALLDSLTSYFNLNSVDDVIAKIYLDSIEKSYIAGFSKVVCENALRGDDVSVQILKEVARDLFMQFVSLQEKCNNMLSAVYLYGSVLKNDKIVREEFFMLIRKKYPELKIKDLCKTPEVGALRYCFDTYKGDLV